MICLWSSPLLLVVLFFVAVLAGFIDSIAGAEAAHYSCADGRRDVAGKRAGD
ncbi:Putative membrane protein YfcA [Salmonella enterica subsp. arizonae]|uniref:Membrane protein YfcA n=1 Tax=Salmonella enterica subsp. arizonae TaxID=59203 RepID=A0A3S4G095_SALER|nr:Putative membrane protein YfcA [Salmonella enterica subsp. arizonae]